MQNDPRTHGLWEVSAPPVPPTEVLTDNITADVVIIGAGFTGLSAALHLAEDKQHAVVLEAGEIGFGGSGRNVGLVNAGMWIKPFDLCNTLGDTLGRRLIDQLSDAPAMVFELVEKYGMACEALNNGTLHCAVGQSGLREVTERARQWRSLGASVELLDAKSTREKVGTGTYSGALLDRRAGTIQPLAYARALARAAIAGGATVHTSSPVVSAEPAPGGWKIKTSRGSVTASRVIVATNTYSNGFSQALQTELVRLPYFNVATRRLSDSLLASILPERQGLWNTSAVLSSMRLDAEGRLIFGSVGALRGTGKQIHRNWARRALSKLFPQLSDVEFEHEWYGWIGMTPDSLPRFHRLEQNIISISGYNGRGIGAGTSFGRDLARLVTGRMTEAELSLPLSEVANTQFRVAKESFYEIGSQVAHMVGHRF
ncbi:NAD(P)/FAD-dependent oxidoreductase [Woeseia oceani]|uniref:FAD-dependent oxidoreductase n=1 Tax=Woeseia oceani TaxID=1548547 RepID=A0A193LBE2_9GAMM|nr:FAD-binding oxidoreductase [Woeseia oceani]ANO49845.1 FAD-dependent oxidoreductase [Woeseia oceani]